MKQLQPMEAMLANPVFFLPGLLNLHGATDLTKVRQLAVADKPALVYAILMAFHMGKPQSRKSLPIIRQLRNLRVDSTGGRTEAQRIFHVGQVDETLLKGFWARLLDSAHLYVDEDGKVTSRIVSTFSYEPDGDYESELSCWQEVECPNCHHSETVNENDEEWPGFKQLSEHYSRCNQCDAVVRLTVSPATSLPAGAEYSDPEAWDYYVEWLEENLETMARHVSRFGRPHNLFIAGSNMDWRGRSGEASCDFTGEALADKLRVNGDFCIRNGKLWLEQDGTASMTCTMYHHDVPTGSSLTITPTWTCELDTDYSIEMSEMTDNTKRCRVAELMLCGDDTVFEYTESTSFMLVSESGLLTGLDWLATQLQVDEWDGVACEAEPDWTPNRALHSAIGWLLRDLIDSIRGKHPYSVKHAEDLRALINVWLKHVDEE